MTNKLVGSWLINSWHRPRHVVPHSFYSIAESRPSAKHQFSIHIESAPRDSVLNLSIVSFHLSCIPDAGGTGKGKHASFQLYLSNLRALSRKLVGCIGGFDQCSLCLSVGTATKLLSGA